MSEPRITRFTVDPTKPRKSKTDWARVDAMTEEEIEASAREDPDAPLLTPDELAEMRRPVDPKAVRAATGLSQEAFAKTFLIPLGTVRDWEQGRSRPDRAAENYLRVIATDPEAAKRAVAAE